MVKMACHVIELHFTSLIDNQEIFHHVGITNFGSKEFVTSSNFDVYLQPLVEELQKLWIGVPTYDVWKPLGYMSFILKGILIWISQDFPRYMG
jgi:hypothetical protein